MAIGEYYWYYCGVYYIYIQEREGVVRERDELNSLAEELGRELHQSKAQVGELRTETEYLNTQLEVCINTPPFRIYLYHRRSILTGGEAVPGAVGRPGGQGQRRQTDSREETRVSGEGQEMKHVCNRTSK